MLIPIGVTYDKRELILECPGSDNFTHAFFATGEDGGIRRFNVGEHFVQSTNDYFVVDVPALPKYNHTSSSHGATYQNEI